MLRFIKDNWQVAVFSAVVCILLTDVWTYAKAETGKAIASGLPPLEPRLLLVVGMSLALLGSLGVWLAGRIRGKDVILADVMSVLTSVLATMVVGYIAITIVFQLLARQPVTINVEGIEAAAFISLMYLLLEGIGTTVRNFRKIQD